MLLTPFGFVIRQRTILNPRTTNCSTKYPSKTIDGTANLIYEIRCWITNWKMPSFVVPGFLYHLDYLLIRSVTIIAAILFTKFIILWIRKKSTPILMFYKIGEDWSKVAIKKEATRHTTNTRELRLCLWKVDLVEAFSADSPLTLVDICGSSLVWQLDVVNLNGWDAAWCSLVHSNRTRTSRYKVNKNKVISAQYFTDCLKKNSARLHSKRSLLETLFSKNRNIWTQGGAEQWQSNVILNLAPSRITAICYLLAVHNVTITKFFKTYELRRSSETFSWSLNYLLQHQFLCKKVPLTPRQYHFIFKQGKRTKRRRFQVIDQQIRRIQEDRLRNVTIKIKKTSEDHNNHNASRKTNTEIKNSTFTPAVRMPCSMHSCLSCFGGKSFKLISFISVNPDSVIYRIY